MYNQVTTLFSSSNLTIKNPIDFSPYNQLCFDLRYYIPKQEWTAQGIYYGILYNNDSYYAAVASTLSEEVTSSTDKVICIDSSSFNENGFPFIEIYNAHSQLPYNGYIANTQIYVRRVYLR